MQEPLLPLFPLNLVLLPGAVLPLHIFEERYKEMIGEALRTQTEFGVVQASDKGILNIGCTATVSQVLNRYEDGRLDISTIGRRRFEIMMLDQEKDYLRASVSFFDDDDDAPEPPFELKAVALAALAALPGEESGEQEQISPGSRLSFQIARRIPDPGFGQMMLAIRSETERLKQIANYLPEYIAKLQRTDFIKKIARTNGHGLPKVEREN